MTNIFPDKKFGFGLMRLPMIGEGDAAQVNIEECCKLVDEFLRRGFTYFDTAWMYCGFKSEEATKEFLVNRHPRESFTLATKLHGGFIKTKEDRDKIFNEQLRKTGAGYFDYYLLHDVGEGHYQLYKDLDCFNWLKDKKSQGLVKHMGFSYHDNAELLDRVLTEQDGIEFVQLQLNYLDWESEGIQSRKCYEVCVNHNVPVIVMEPVKGGTLAKVPDEVTDMFKAYAPDASVPSWAIRFAASHENVKMVLSGMSNMEQVMDNTSYMQDFKPLNEEEMALIKKVVAEINKKPAIACTACSQCTEGCPQNIAIPRFFSLYNTEMQEDPNKEWTAQPGYYANLSVDYGKPSDCIECGLCESVCPEGLSIINYLKDIAKHFEP